jgi:predicted esterase
VAAGRAYVDESLLSPEHPPFYIAVGALDQQSVQNSAENLAYVLSLQGWPHEFVLHPNRGHELGADDFDDAWQLWTSR